MDQLDSLFSTNVGILATLALAAWRYFAGSKASGVEQRIEQCARAACERAFAALATGGVDASAVLELARRYARENIERLGLPMKETQLALVEHVIDLVMSEHAADVRKEEARSRALQAVVVDMMGKLSAVKIPTPEELHREWDAAEAEGRARVTGDKPELTIVPPDPVPS